MKRKAKVAEENRTRVAASAAHPRAAAGDKATMRRKSALPSGGTASARLVTAGSPTRQPSVAASARAQAEDAAERAFREWIRRYEPVERAIYAERARREASKRRRARERLRAFGDLCEATEGLAAFADRSGITLEEARRELWRIRPFHPALALPCMLLTDAWTGLAAMRRLLTWRIDRAKHEAKRPAYYAQERARRQALAAERRKVPTRLEILDAWTKVKDSPEALLRFGSLMEDLECYVDNSLRRTEDGVIIGRRPGIKGWLQLEIPALYLKYKTVMAYKAAAKRMRQVLDIRDPLPLSAALGETLDYGADEIQGRASGGRETGNGEEGTGNGERGTGSRGDDLVQGERKTAGRASGPDGGGGMAMDGQTGTGGSGNQKIAFNRPIVRQVQPTPRTILIAGSGHRRRIGQAEQPVVIKIHALKYL